jgi:glutamine synthetase
MSPQEIVMVCYCDIAGQVRGKGFPARDLEARRRKGVGWTPTNIMITAHGPIGDTPWGPFGDLVLLPDPDTHVRIDFGDGSAAENFVLADVTNLDGSPWSCCPRTFLKRGLDALAAEFGFKLKAAFEHEFHYDAVEERPNSSYALDAFRRQGRFAETLLGALEEAGVELDTFMPEYGPAQYEVTVGAADGLRAADQAVLLREVVRATAQRFGARASFTPILRPNAVGNGVHVHFSLEDVATVRPVSHDAARPHGLSEPAGSFLAGILARMPALTAVTAPATISYLRLVPHRWSAAYANLGLRDREAGVRICPVFETTGVDAARQYHFEYRAADAAASPYLLLGAIVWAGLSGLRQRLPPPQPTTSDPDAMSEAERNEAGIERLPRSLDEALDRFAADAECAAWMGDDLHRAYLAHKRFEARTLGALSLEEQCERYRLAY